jgi:ABC-type transport system involved in Fe-S cluster assembly fused permease/ATPase subunit
LLLSVFCLQDIVNIILFNVVPQMIDIVVACSYLATKMQPWVAGIVLVTVSSYVPLTVCITERRGKVCLVRAWKAAAACQSQWSLISQ